MSKERAINRVRTAALELYTVACALLFVTWMTLPPIVTATRRVPSGDHATFHTCHVVVKSQNKREQKAAHTSSSNFTVYTFACVAILMMQSKLSSVQVANKVPSGEIAPTLAWNRTNLQISRTSKSAKQRQHTESVWGQTVDTWKSFRAIASSSDPAVADSLRGAQPWRRANSTVSKWWNVITWTGSQL